MVKPFYKRNQCVTKTNSSRSRNVANVANVANVLVIDEDSAVKAIKGTEQNSTILVVGVQ